MFVDVFMQHAMSMRRILLLYVACLSLPYFLTLIKKLCDFFRRGQKIIGHKMCVLIFSENLPEKYSVLRIIPRDFIVNVY